MKISGLNVLFLVFFLPCAAVSFGAESLRGLYLTSPGIYHNYQSQAEAITGALASRVNVRFDVSLHELSRWKTTDYAQGYDVLIYNICDADNQDAQLIANHRRQLEDLGVPALFIHCTMHSYRETQLWWPVVGLETLHHEDQHAMSQRRLRQHPVVNSVPADWVVQKDELYINRSFLGEGLLGSPGLDGETHVTAWLHSLGDTRLFGTTLGHNESTISDPVFQQMLANALLYVTGHLDDSGVPAVGYGAVASMASSSAIDGFSAGQGEAYLNPQCSSELTNKAMAPCYITCILHPLKWGEDADTCKRQCSAERPTTQELLGECAAPI